MEIEPCANVLLVEELDMWAELQIRLYEAALANVFDLNFYCNFYIIRIACRFAFPSFLGVFVVTYNDVRLNSIPSCNRYTLPLKIRRKSRKFHSRG